MKVDMMVELMGVLKVDLMVGKRVVTMGCSMVEMMENMMAVVMVAMMDKTKAEK